MPMQLLKTSKFGFIDLVVKLMEKVESFVDMTGLEKKSYVIEEIKEQIGLAEYEEYENIIDNVIEFVIAMSRNQYDLNLNRIAKCCTLS